MRSTLPKSPPPSPLNAVLRKLARVQMNSGAYGDGRPASRAVQSGSIDLQADSGHGRTDLNSLVRDAMARADLSQKAFAINAGAKESQVSDALAGRGHLASSWLWKQPVAFWVEFVALVGEAKGLTQPDRRKQALAGVIKAVEQLVMSWSDE